QRRREIGVRMALGATAGVVRREVVSQGTRVVLIGVVIGLATAVGTTRLLSTLLFGVKAVDPIVFAAMAAMMVGMGMLASYVPARRASNVDPIETLRSD
ncbi:MAG TPA: FtsX-like permease family protein, partial [Gemmatimonadales bacterium]|nr:FtsX-like permease family protein [Gemmatimonadales bacterium]